MDVVYRGSRSAKTILAFICKVASMSTVIEVDGDRFEADATVGPSGQTAYSFRWLNGPIDSSYGFSLAPGVTPGTILTNTDLENEARLFVRAFFSPDGVGPADFPDFVASRQGG